MLKFILLALVIIAFFVYFYVRLRIYFSNYRNTVIPAKMIVESINSKVLSLPSELFHLSYDSGSEKIELTGDSPYTFQHVSLPVWQRVLKELNEEKNCLSLFFVHSNHPPVDIQLIAKEEEPFD